MKTISIILSLIFLLRSQLSGQVSINGLNSLNFLKNYKVVLLGEPSHAEGNVLEVKADVVRYLHDSLGFNVIAFESGFYDVYYTAQLINKNPSISSRGYLDNAIFPIWMASKQFTPFLNYYEKNKKTLQIAGFDCQLTGDYSKSYLVDSMLSIISRYAPGSMLKIDKSILDEAVDGFSEDFTFPEDVSYKDFQGQLNRVVLSFKNIAARPELSNKEVEMIEWYLQSAYNLQSIAQDYYSKRGRVLNEETFKAKDSNPRDSMMAQNLLALMKLYPNEKIICWGAGTHFMNDPSLIGNEELKSYKPMGAYLKKSLGDDKVFNLTFIAPKGHYALFNEPEKTVPAPIANSIEYNLEKLHSDTLILLKGSAYSNQQLISYCLEYKPVKADWSKLFDAFIFLKEFTPNTTNQNTNSTLQHNSNVADISNVDISKHTTEKSTDGFIVDAADNKRLAYAVITSRRSGFETQSNNNGEFQIPRDKTTDTITVYMIGYEPRRVVLKTGIVNFVKLTPLNSTLAEVKVTAKKINAIDIIKKVKENFELNYGSHAFRQEVCANRTIKNFDSILFDQDYVLDKYINIHQSRKMDINYKERRSNKMDSSYWRQNIQLSVPLGGGDVIRNGALFKGSRYKKFEFRLLSSFSDTVSGKVYKIAFRAKKLSGRYTDDYFTDSYYGVLFIRDADYAVIALESKLVRKVGSLQNWTEKYYTKGDKKWSIFPEAEVSIEFASYYKNNADNKYYVKFSSTEWQKRGYLMANHQPVEFVSDYSIYDIGRIATIDDVNALPYSTFKFPNQISYNPGFWNAFVFPKKNDRTYQKSDE